MVPVAPERPVELARRWGVGARMVSMTLESDGAKSEYAGGGFTASYRITRRWEVAVAFDALDAPQGPDLHSMVATARFHFRPLWGWDVYALAGLGGLHEQPTEGSEDHGVGRGQFHIGAGVGKRWRRIGVAAELHGIAVGPPEEEAAHHMTTRETPMASTEEISGGELTIAAAFYF